MRRWLAPLALLLPTSGWLASQSPLEDWAARRALDAASPYADLVWQALGPQFCGGRIESIAVRPDDPRTIYVAPGSGNLWRSRDGGARFEPLFEHEATCAIGHVAIAPADPDVVWVGTGEAHLGGISFDGCGVYRSEDGGETWTHTGLEQVGRIGKVVLHPVDLDRVLVAAINPRGRAGERGGQGVFRTEDGGATWEQVLPLPAGVAAIDLVAFEDDPSRLLAASWDRAGQDRSGVHRSVDGGATWERLGGDHGLPVGAFLERVAVAVSASSPDVAYALFVDQRKPGEGRYGVGGVVYRTDDRGDSWSRCHEDYIPTYVGWDFCDVVVAPDDADTLFVCGMKLIVSRDGGQTWSEVPEVVERRLPFGARGIDTESVLHLDAHDLWIDPVNPDRLLLGNDGGLFESTDRGGRWLHHNTLPIAEFYTVHVEQGSERPFRVWGGTQDNASVTGPARPLDAGGQGTWRHVFLDRWAGGDGFATFPDPTDPDVVYFEHQNGDMRRKTVSGSTLSGTDDVRIRPRGRDLAFAWNTPLFASAHDPKRLYCASQHVFRSDDRGDSWTRIGDDLGRGRGLVALAESPLRDGVLYAGLGGGEVHATRDGGVTWARAAGLPPGELHRPGASRHVPDRVYACMRGRAPKGLVLVSDDRGVTWRDLSKGLPPEPVRVLVEDARDRRVLYVGTEAGILASTNEGRTWESLSNHLPTAVVMDLAFQDSALQLIAATHGRGLFMTDVGRVRPSNQGD
jgi:photosystem II stability/assembly factor-like uncharacterized protein